MLLSRGKNEADEARTAGIEVGLLFILFCAPAAFGSVYPWASMGTAAFIFALIFLNPSAIFRLRSVPLFFSAGIFAVLTGVFFQALFFSASRHHSLESFLGWTAVSVFVLLICRLPRPAILRFCCAFVFLGVLESAYGLYEVFSHREKVFWHVKEAHLGFVTGTYLNRNHMAGLLELCLGIQLGLWLKAFMKKQYFRILFFGAAFFLEAFAFIKTGSRMGVISFAASCIFLFPFLLKTFSKGGGAFIVLTSIMGAAAFMGGSGVLMGRFAMHGNPAASLIDPERIKLWNDVWTMILAHRWTGVGLGNFEWVFPSFQSAMLPWGYAHAHQDYLELASEIGLPLAGLLVFLFACLWLRCFAVLVTRPHFSPVLWGCLLSLLSLSLHGLADFNLAIPANALLFIGVWAAAFRLSQFSRLEKETLYDEF